MRELILYLLGLAGMWIFLDGLISIRLYYNKLTETGNRKQNWKYDHSIRLIRMLIGIGMMIAGFVL